MHCTCRHVLYILYFSLSKFCSAKCSAPLESQPNSMPATRELRGSPACDRNRTPHPKTVQSKTVAVRGMSNKPPHAALRAEGRKAEGRKFQYQPVHLNMWHNMRFSFAPWYSLTYPREKALFYLQNWLTYARSRFIRGRARKLY